MSKIRMLVLKPFTRNLDGSIVSGHPNHPEESGHYVFVTEGSAKILEDAKEARPWSEKDQARAEIEAEKLEGKEDLSSEEAGFAARMAAAKRAKAAEERPTANKVRDERTSPAGRRRRGKTEVTPPVGGTDTIATTNHATAAAVAGAGEGNEVSSGVPHADPDAAPTE